MQFPNKLRARVQILKTGGCGEVTDLSHWLLYCSVDAYKTIE